MGTTIAFCQSPGTALLVIVISSNLARYGIMASLSNFKISPAMPSGPTDFFLPIADNRFYQQWQFSTIHALWPSTIVTHYAHKCLKYSHCTSSTKILLFSYNFRNSTSTFSKIFFLSKCLPNIGSCQATPNVADFIVLTMIAVVQGMSRK